MDTYTLITVLLFFLFLPLAFGVVITLTPIDISKRLRNISAATAKVLSMLTLIGLLIPLAVAQPLTQSVELNFIGENDYELGRGKFNSNIDTESVIPYSKTLSNGRQAPVYADVNDDGVIDIFIVDADELEAYSFDNTALSRITGLDHGSSEAISPLLLFDVDGDGTKEILYAEEESEELNIIGFNGSTFTQEATIDLSVLSNHDTTSLAAGDIILQCRDTNDCLLVWTKRQQAGTNSPQSFVGARVFNSTDLVGSDLTVFSDLVAPFFSSVNCFSDIQSIALADMDSPNDGIAEYIFTYTQYTGEGVNDDGMRVVVINVTNNQAGINWQTTFGSVQDVHAEGGSADCRSADSGERVGRMFSPATVANLDSDETGNEVAVAYMVDASGFEIELLGRDGDSLDEYGQNALSSDADATKVSNVFVADIFTGSQNQNENDFCAYGLNFASQEIEILCATEDGAGTGSIVTGIRDHAVFEGDISNNNNFTVSSSMNLVAHAAQQVQTVLINGDNVGEIVNAYGVWSVNHEACLSGSGFECDATLEFTNTFGDAVFISGDVANNEEDDIIIFSDNLLTVLDDNIPKVNTQISEVFTNPCINDTWKINTTVKFDVTVVDGLEDNDNATVQIDVYSGDTNQFSDELGNLTVVNGEATAPFTFTANKTGTHIIQIRAFDTGSNNVDTANLGFSVNTNGLEFGDSSCKSTFVVTEEEAEQNQSILGESEAAANNEGLKNALRVAAEESSTSPFLVYTILMGLGTVAAIQVFGVIAGLVVGVLFLIGGITLGVFGAGIIAIIVVTIIAGIFLIRLTLGRHAGDGR